jgi:hypothetical protein
VSDGGRRLVSFLTAMGFAIAVSGHAVPAQQSSSHTSAARSSIKRPAAADSMYRSAREAMVRGDIGSAIGIFAGIANRYPKSDYATAALYYRAFLQYREYKPGSPGPLRDALATVKRLERSYPNAPQRNDAQALHTRICAELAQLGDAACREEVVAAAREAVPQAGAPYNSRRTMSGPKDAGAAPGQASGTFSLSLGKAEPSAKDNCGNDEVVANAINALVSLWKADSAQAIDQTNGILSLRSHCYLRLRQQALLLLMQRSTPIMSLAPAVFDAARFDPDPGVRNLATIWLVNQEWDPQAAKFLGTIFGRPFRVKH